MSQSDSALEAQYVYRQRFTVEIIWATSAPEDAFDDAMTDALSSITGNGGTAIIWRAKPGPVERMGADLSPDLGDGLGS